MMKPLKEWICDVCHEVIPSPDTGYALWRTDAEGHPYDFRIIHQTKCDDKRIHHSKALDEFLGEDGIAELIAFISPGPIKCSLGDRGIDCPKDLDNFADFFRRVQTPYYEEVRTKFSNPDLLDDNSDNNELAPYLPENLKRMIEKYE